MNARYNLYLVNTQTSSTAGALLAIIPQTVSGSQTITLGNNHSYSGTLETGTYKIKVDKAGVQNNMFETRPIIITNPGSPTSQTSVNNASIIGALRALLNR